MLRKRNLRSNSADKECCEDYNKNNARILQNLPSVISRNSEKIFWFQNYFSNIFWEVSSDRSCSKELLFWKEAFLGEFPA